MHASGGLTQKLWEWWLTPCFEARSKQVSDNEKSKAKKWWVFLQEILYMASNVLKMSSEYMSPAMNCYFALHSGCEIEQEHQLVPVEELTLQGLQRRLHRVLLIWGCSGGTLWLWSELHVDRHQHSTVQVATLYGCEDETFLLDCLSQ